MLQNECREIASGASVVGSSLPPACVACPVKDRQVSEAKKIAAHQQQELLEAQAAWHSVEAKCEHLVSEVNVVGDQLSISEAQAKDKLTQLRSAEQYLIELESKSKTDFEHFRLMEQKLREAQDQLLNQGSVAKTQSAEIDRLNEANGIVKNEIRDQAHVLETSAVATPANKR